MCRKWIIQNFVCYLQNYQVFLLTLNFYFKRKGTNMMKSKTHMLKDLEKKCHVVIHTAPTVTVASVIPITATQIAWLLH